ncbi:hypothetical protein FI667_g16079, partial [Globisporangium splendens]
MEPSLIASKAIVPGTFNDKKSDAEDEHHTHTMMCAARMKYLDDTDQIQPDTMFMTRKQAQKVAQRRDTGTISLKKLDVGSPLRKPNAANAASANASLTAWKKANKAATDEKNQIWGTKSGKPSSRQAVISGKTSRPRNADSHHQRMRFR